MSRLHCVTHNVEMLAYKDKLTPIAAKPASLLNTNALLARHYYRGNTSRLYQNMKALGPYRCKLGLSELPFPHCVFRVDDIKPRILAIDVQLRCKNPKKEKYQRGCCKTNKTPWPHRIGTTNSRGWVSLNCLRRTRYRICGFRHARRM